MMFVHKLQILFQLCWNYRLAIGVGFTGLISVVFAFVGVYGGGDFTPWFIASLVIYGLELIYTGGAAYKHWHHPVQIRRRARVKRQKIAKRNRLRTQKERLYYPEESPERARTFS